MKVVFILSDATRWDYLNFMPFLKQQSGNSYYIKKIKPGVGFCEISEYLTGISSIENGNLFQITFNGNYSRQKYSFLQAINWLSTKIPKIRWKAAKIIDNYLKKKQLFYDSRILNVRYAIPINMLNYFMPTESIYKYDSEKFFPESNFILNLKKNGHTCDLEDFVEHNKIQGTDEERLERLNKKILGKELKDFTLLYIGKGEMAHIKGTKSKVFYEKMIEYDKKLENIYDNLKANYQDDFALVVLGDHGMVDVNHYINVTKIIRKITEKGIEIGKDFVYFIDSTCLRIWIKDKSNILDIDEIVRKYLNPYIDDSVETEKFDKKYGDLVYMIKPGNMLFPDFFNMYRQRGMHGYTNDIEEQWGMCIIMGNVKKRMVEILELTKMKNIVLELFGITND